MNPVVMRDGLLSVLAHADVPVRGFARELHAIHEDIDARCVRDNLAR